MSSNHSEDRNAVELHTTTRDGICKIVLPLRMVGDHFAMMNSTDLQGGQVDSSGAFVHAVEATGPRWPAPLALETCPAALILFCAQTGPRRRPLGPRTAVFLTPIARVASERTSQTSQVTSLRHRSSVIFTRTLRIISMSNGTNKSNDAGLLLLFICVFLTILFSWYIIIIREAKRDADYDKNNIKKQVTEWHSNNSIRFFPVITLRKFWRSCMSNSKTT